MVDADITCHAARAASRAAQASLMYSHVARGVSGVVRVIVNADLAIWQRECLGLARAVCAGSSRIGGGLFHYFSMQKTISHLL